MDLLSWTYQGTVMLTLHWQQPQLQPLQPQLQQQPAAEAPVAGMLGLGKQHCSSCYSHSSCSCSISRWQWSKAHPHSPVGSAWAEQESESGLSPVSKKPMEPTKLPEVKSAEKIESDHSKMAYAYWESNETVWGIMRFEKRSLWAIVCKYFRQLKEKQ